MTDWSYMQILVDFFLVLNTEMFRNVS